jgi:hypothetical protein
MCVVAGRRIAAGSLVGVVALAGCGRIGFEPGDGADGGEVGATVVDARALVPRTVVTFEGSLAGGIYVARAVDDGGLGPPCDLTGVRPEVARVVGHPTVPYVYGLTESLWGVRVACGLDDAVQVGLQADAGRPRADLVLAPALDAGFATFDGIDAIGVARVDLASDGTPANPTSAVAPPMSGALQLDATRGLLVVAGAGAASVNLLGDALSLGSEQARNFDGCDDAIALVPVGGGDDLLAFCGDQPAPQRWRVSDAGLITDVVDVNGVAAAVVAVAAMPSAAARVVLATSGPDAVTLASLDGAGVAEAATALLPAPAVDVAVSADGQLVVAALASGAIHAWRIDGDALVELGPPASSAAPVLALGLTVAIGS